MSNDRTQDFYDEFWPKNVPHIEETRKYMLDLITGRSYKHALDGGCGHGICSVVLSEIAEKVTAVDVSPNCVACAKAQAERYGRSNITHSVQDLQDLAEADRKFDLVWCWGVAMMAPDPIKVMNHLMRVTAPGGEVYLGLYLKTWLSPAHQFVRWFSRTFMGSGARKQLVLDGFAWLTEFIVKLRGSEINVRADNVSIQAQVDDWYYPPHKTFYSIEEIIALFEKNGFEAKCIQDRVGRMKSATIFVIKGVRKQG